MTLSKHKEYINQRGRESKIDYIVNQYKQSFQIGDQIVKFSDEQIEKYRESLRSLKDKELKKLSDHAKKTFIQYKVLDKVKKLFGKKKTILVTLFRKNNTVTHHVIDSRLKSFKIEDREYIVEISVGRQNLDNKMFALYYFEDIPVPLKVTDKGYDFLNSETVKQVFDLKYLQAMTQVADLEKFFKLSLLMSGGAVVGVIIVIVILLQNKGVF